MMPKNSRNSQFNNTISDFNKAGMNSTASTAFSPSNRVQQAMRSTAPKLNCESQNSGAFAGVRGSAMTNITSGSIISPKSMTARRNILSPGGHLRSGQVNVSELQNNLNKTFSNLQALPSGAQRKNDNGDISSKIQKSLINCSLKRKKQNK